MREQGEEPTVLAQAGDPHLGENSRISPLVSA